MKSTTSHLHIGDYLCEARSHWRLDAPDGARCAAVEATAGPDPEGSPHEHSAPHPSRFDPPPVDRC